MATPLTIRGLDQSNASGGLARGFRVNGSVQASLTTNFAGSNNDLIFTAKTAGTGGNAITVAFVVAGALTPLTVSVSGNAITVNVATTAGSAASSTAAQVKTAVDASGPASALVSVSNAPGNDGTGVVAAQGATNLTGGAASANLHLKSTTNTVVDLDDQATRKALLRNQGRFIPVVGGANLTTIRGLEFSEATGGSPARSFRIKNSAGANVTVTHTSNVTVDVSDPGVRKILRREFGKYIVASGNTAVIRNIDQSRGTGTPARGFRVKNSGGTLVQATGSNVTVDLTDSYTRRVLRRNLRRFVSLG